MTVTVGVSLKAYFGHRQTLDWVDAVAELVPRPPPELELFLLPSFLTLPAAAMALVGTGIAVGAQDLSAADSGDQTGEVTGGQLAEIGSRYAETGHAERRDRFGETDSIVAAKTSAALRHGLIPVLCLGEIDRVPPPAAVAECLRQLRAALPAPVVGRVLVAYEPRWAIGAAEPAGDDHIVAVVEGLKSALLARAPDSGVIYGGSAGPGLLTRLGHAVDGLFLGRFAHDPRAFAAVVAEAEGLIRQPQEMLR